MKRRLLDGSAVGGVQKGHPVALEQRLKQRRDKRPHRKGLRLGEERIEKRKEQSF